MDLANFRLIIDDRPPTDANLRAWSEHMDADVIWFVSQEPGAESQPAEVIPLLPFSPADIAVVFREVPAEGRRVLVVFPGGDALEEASRFDLPAQRVTLVHLERPGNRPRLAPGVVLDDVVEEQLRLLAEAGFTFVVQPLPNVTARPFVPPPRV